MKVAQNDFSSGERHLLAHFQFCGASCACNKKNKKEMKKKKKTKTGELCFILF